MADLANEREGKYLKLWLRHKFSTILYYKIYRWLNPSDPFFTPRAIKYISSHLNRDMKVFEWGSGASTFWFSKRVGMVHSIEHDEGWYSRGLENIKLKGCNNVSLTYSPPVDLPADFDWHQWKYYPQLQHSLRKPDFLTYLQEIDKYPDNFFDCIVIDGRERVGCALHAMPKLKVGGFIVLDDSMRPKYREIFNIYEGWKAEVFDFGLIQTTVFSREE